MYLSARSAGPDDLASVFLFLGKRLYIPPSEHRDLMRMWRQIMAEADHCALVVEDSERKEGERAVAFAFKFSVPEAVMNYARSEAPPQMWRWTLARWRLGQRFWQERRETRKNQLDSGAFYFCFNGVDIFHYDGLDIQRVVDALTTAVVKEFSRHRTRYSLMEAYGPTHRDRLIAYGMRVLSDYRNHYEYPEFRALPEEQRPYLMAADYEEAAEDKELRNVGQMARLGPPKFGFSDAEQEVLRHALRGMTDQVIAEELGLSLVAIKKRWEGIYEKVNERAYLQAWVRGETEPGSKLGRRQVLQMLAEHPEEFWPSFPRRRLDHSGRLSGGG